MKENDPIRFSSHFIFWKKLHEFEGNKIFMIFSVSWLLTKIFSILKKKKQLKQNQKNRYSKKNNLISNPLTKKKNN